MVEGALAVRIRGVTVNWRPFLLPVVRCTSILRTVLSFMNIEFFKGFFCGKIFIFDSARMDQSMD